MLEKLVRVCQEGYLKSLACLARVYSLLLSGTRYLGFPPRDESAKIEDPSFEDSILDAQHLKDPKGLSRKTVKMLLLRHASKRPDVVAEYIVNTTFLPKGDKVKIAVEVLKNEPRHIKRFLRELKVSKEQLTDLTIEALRSDPHLLPEVIDLLDERAKKEVGLALAREKPEEIADYLRFFEAFDDGFKTKLALTVAQRCPHKLICRISDLRLSDRSKCDVATAIRAKDPYLVLTEIHMFEIQDSAYRAKIAFSLIKLVDVQIVFNLENFQLEERDRLIILKELLNNYPSTVTRNIQRFGISDLETRVALAEKLIELVPFRVAENFRAFQIEDPRKRQELAKKILERDAEAVRYNLENFDLGVEALVDLAIELIKSTAKKYSSGCVVSMLLQTETLLGLFLEKVDSQKGLCVFEVADAIEQTCKELQEKPGLGASSMLKRVLKQNDATKDLADVLDLVSGGVVFIICAALCKHRSEIPPNSNPEEKLRLALQKICWFVKGDIKRSSLYTTQEIFKTLLNFARHFKEEELNFSIDARCFDSKQDRERAFRVLNIMVTLKRLQGQEWLSAILQGLAAGKKPSKPFVVDLSNLSEVEAKLREQLESIFIKALGLKNEDESKVRQFLEAVPDVYPFLAVLSRVYKGSFRLALINAVKQFVEDPTGEWRYSRDNSDQLPFSQKVVEAWRQNPGQLFFVKERSVSESSEDCLVRIESQVKRLRELLDQHNIEVQSQESFGSDETLDKFFEAQEPINEDSIKRAISLFFQLWDKAHSGGVLNQAAVIDVHRVISWVVKEAARAHEEAKKLQQEAAEAHQSKGFSLPSDIFKSLQAVKQSLEDFIGVNGEVLGFYTIVTDDPYLLFTVGSLVDGVRSCLRFESTGEPEVLIAHLLDANIKLIATYCFSLGSVGSPHLRLKLLTGQAECYLDPRFGKLIIQCGDEKIELPATPVGTRILRIGWHPDDQNQEESAKVLVEPRYGRSFGDEGNITIRAQERKVLERFCEGIGKNSLSWNRIKIGATRNPGGVHTDIGGGRQRKPWVVERTSKYDLMCYL